MFQGLYHPLLLATELTSFSLFILRGGGALGYDPLGRHVGTLLYAVILVTLLEPPAFTTQLLQIVAVLYIALALMIRA